MAHVYIDVSGSMDDCLPWLVEAMAPLHQKGLCRLYAFSTVVDEVSRGDIRRQRIKNTFGTDINCVYRHLLTLPKARSPRKVVVLTDGCTGNPESGLAKAWQERKVDLYVGLVGENWACDLRPYAKRMENLPDPN